MQSRDSSRLLRNHVTNACVRSTGSATNYLVDQENCHDFPSQRYAFANTAAVTTMLNEATNRCLSAGNAPVKASQVLTEVCDGGGAQQWRITKTTVDNTPVMRFQNVLSNLCLAVPGANLAEGTKIILWPCGQLVQGLTGRERRHTWSSAGVAVQQAISRDRRDGD